MRKQKFGANKNQHLQSDIERAPVHEIVALVRNGQIMAAIYRSNWGQFYRLIKHLRGGALRKHARTCTTCSQLPLVKCYSVLQTLLYGI